MSAAVKIVVFVIILSAVIGILAFLPQIEIDKDAVISSSAWSSAWSWVRAALYFLPIHTVINIGTAVIGLGIFTLSVAAVKTFWDVLPFH